MTEGTPEQFGALLRRHRLSQRLSQEALAELAGLSVRTVRNLERRAVAAPRNDSVRRLSDALGLAGDDLTAFLDAHDDACHPDISIPRGRGRVRPSELPAPPDIRRRAGELGLTQNRHDEAAQHIAASIALLSRTDKLVELAYSHCAMGNVRHSQGRLVEAHDCYTQAQAALAAHVRLAVLTADVDPCPA